MQGLASQRLISRVTGNVEASTQIIFGFASLIGTDVAKCLELL
jgi:hypothetical protein